MLKEREFKNIYLILHNISHQVTNKSMEQNNQAWGLSYLAIIILVFTKMGQQTILFCENLIEYDAKLFLSHL